MYQVRAPSYQAQSYIQEYLLQGLSFYNTTKLAAAFLILHLNNMIANVRLYYYNTMNTDQDKNTQAKLCNRLGPSARLCKGH